MASDLGRLIRRDAEESVERSLSRRGVLAVLLTSRGVQVVMAYRIGHALHASGWGALSAVLQRMAQILYAADVDYRARIGGGLVLRHPAAIVVGRDVVLGERVRLFQGVTLGKRLSGSVDRPDGMPILEDDVHVFAGAAVLGPVRLGARTRVGANAVLLVSCPPDSRVSAPVAHIVSS